MGITHRVTPFMEWLIAASGEPHQGIAALTIMEITDTKLEKRQEIQT